MAEEPKRQPPVLDGASLAPFTLRGLLLYFLRLGTLGFGGPLCSLRQPALDSRHVLRDWGGGHCDHCKKRNQTGPHYGRERLAPLGNLWVDRANHSVDQI